VNTTGNKIGQKMQTATHSHKVSPLIGSQQNILFFCYFQLAVARW